jgi:hypothetical protein
MARLTTDPAYQFHTLQKDVFNVTESWNASDAKVQFMADITRLILPQDSILIDSAVCLGLGSLTMPESVPGWVTQEDLRTVHAERRRRIRQFLAFETLLDVLSMTSLSSII